MIVVADSTPLISLCILHKLNLLQRLYGHVLIAPAVFREVVTEGQGRPGAAEVATADWIETRPLANPALLPGMRPNLGPGEAETIVLARELPAELVVMDEAAGRRELMRRPLPLIGTVGVLQQAKLRGLIAARPKSIFDFAPHFFDRSQIRRVGRQEEHISTSLPDQ